jgi:hypothetical protein
MFTAFSFLKDSFAYINYLLGFSIMARVAAAIATPIAGLFMLTLLSDKTESYGRNFINFWLSMVFSSIGLAAMAGVVAHAVGAINDLVIGAGVMKLAGLAAAASFGDIFYGCCGAALAFFVAGGMFGFAMNLIQKGSAIGNGIFSGHFNA